MKEPESVKTPEEYRKLFLNTEKKIKKFFSNQKHEPKKGKLTIGGERYIFLNAEMGYHFRKTAEKIVGPQNASMFVTKFFNNIGKKEAQILFKKLKLKTTQERLAAGLIYFSYSGLAFVEKKPDKIKGEDFVFVYEHPNSFEAETYLKKEGKSNRCVCHISEGYPAGWCSSAFGTQLVGKEISCIAKGDKTCRFVMAPPHKIVEMVEKAKRIYNINDSA